MNSKANVQAELFPSVEDQFIQREIKRIDDFLKSRDPEDFGCACFPDWECGPCRARRQQSPLRVALLALRGALR